MTRVNSNTEWGTLKEVILGRAENAQIPKIKLKDMHCVDYADYNSVKDLPGGNYDLDIIYETVEDLDSFQKQLESIGIKVFRPEIMNFSKEHSLNSWSSDGYYNYCPRDSTLIIGDMIIETPMPLRSRYFENFSYRKILKKYALEGSRWISAPKGELSDELYDRSDLQGSTLTDFEPAFDAANIIRCGKDIFYLISNSGNRFGAHWLQTTLGSSYNVHILNNIYAYVHLDTSILPLSPGVVLLNPDRVNNNNIPPYFKSWKKIWANKPIETKFKPNWAPASPWLGMNVLSIDENTVAVEKNQIVLIKQLEKHGFDIFEVSLRHSRTLSGGPHCVTLDTVRDDEYDDFS